MPAPSFSVIVVTRDRPARLADALASVVAQGVRALDVRIGDDGDVPVIETLPALPLLELTAVKVRCGQAGAARNAAAAEARGDVLVFVDDVDLWRPGHVAGFARAFADPALEFAWRDAEVVRERRRDDGAREVLERAVLAREPDDASLRTWGAPPACAWAVRRALFERLGGFDESFRFAEDWDFALRAAVLTRPRRVPGVTAQVRSGVPDDAPAGAGEERRDCLARLAARHGLPHLEARSWWDLARASGAPA